MSVIVRVISPAEHRRVQMMCSAWGYLVKLNLADTVFLAEEADRGMGIVRRTSETNVLMLRTMLVTPTARGRGVGTQLLLTFVRCLEGRECYCVPYRHLIPFYERGGFLRAQSKYAPMFLQERLARYRLEGLDVVLMRRPPQKETA